MELKEKFELYKELIKTQQDKNGFIYTDQCDSLLFSGLVGSIPDVDVQIDAACDNGMWLRRPKEYTPCYDCSQPWNLWNRIKDIINQKAWKDKKLMSNLFEKGGSSISRDMFVGLSWYAYCNKRLDISESVIKYALSRWCIMGKGVPTRTFMTPGLLATYAEISYRLGGPNRWWLRYLPQFENKKAIDFEAHLSILHILLRQKLTGKQKFKDTLNIQFNRQPQNPLFAYASGEKELATNILMTEKYWPNDRLPTSHDRSSDWLIQRDFGLDWMPANDYSMNIAFSGGDFLFVANLILNS